MKKKKVRVITKVRDTSIVIYNSDRIRVNKELNGELFFEIDNELTTDLAEAIAIVLNKGINDTIFWKTTYRRDKTKIK